MDEKVQQTSRDHMEALNALAQTNLKIGEARGLLVKLQEDETFYLIERERKAEMVIQGMLERSGTLLAEISKNYAEVMEYSRDVASLGEFIVSMSEDLRRMVEEFDAKDAAWWVKVGKQNEEFEKIRKDIKRDQILVNNDRIAVEAEKAKIALAWRKISDENSQIERAIKRLKENRI